ncbi:c-type cytochrome biogenesis protein CcsB [Thermodesulfobacterium sp. TA1]|uniref:cytochrome c biogenesis protein CcsA n=1 Tax=Thermodesulfobacterium sp. TA1 TaxID=2234087 RepID=UPI001232EC49|nr:cytochrome c biogenesis protein CcsA [Thermodesulfobacterium sp. TA1]QER42879.1 c-type cytochrome biogenesis protein CcsB [Thermodesulfobacterium sp. TA1]
MRFKNIVFGFLLALFVYLGFFRTTIFPENSLIFSLATFVYFLAALVYFIYWIFKWEKGGFIGSVIGWTGLFLNLTAFLVRWYQTHQAGFGYVPLSNLYESLVFFGLCIALIYLIIEFKLPSKALGSIVFTITALIMAYASLKANTEIKPLVPALKSNWLIAHVITCFLGYGAFAVTFGLSVFYLIGRNKYLSDLFQISLENFIYRLMLFGFFWLSLGIITGAVWADQAWGSYWSWDPKETWSFITWLIYGGAIHLRFLKGSWGGKRLAWLNIIGFASVLFTYFGVNFLLSGLHSYATPGS